jgi:radical SAM superfamily enzyme YgiQ (UPF0313 family)
VGRGPAAAAIRRMKVVLIYAKAQDVRFKAAELFSDETATKGELARDEIYPPLGISILGAILEQKGYEVRLMDDSIDALEDLKEGMRWADVVGLSVLTPNARRGRELGRIAREEIGRPVIMGGPHPTTNPEFFLESGAADVCAQGEGDLTLPAWLEVFDRRERWSEVLGITYLADGALFATPRRPLIKQVDELPFPAYHLWDIPRYMRLMVIPGVTVVTSRGCPYACTFCDAEMTPRQYRAMSPERTVDLIEHILGTYNPPQIAFFDDLFTIQRKRVIAICKEIVKRDLFFEWTCESRVDTMDYEMLRWMRKAGCAKVYYGLESGSPDMLVTMKKGVTIDKVVRGARLNRELGMYFKFFMLYGFPEETVEDHRKSEEVIRRTRPNHVCCGILQPIPGTEVYEQLKPYLLQDVAEMDFHYWHAVETWKHPTFTHEELKEERDRLIEEHAKATYGLVPKLRRKAERLWALIRKPELIGDLIEIRARRKRYHKRLRESEWGYTLSTRRDGVRLQVPTAAYD